MDQTRQLAEFGFMRDGHIGLTFLNDTVGPTRLYIQHLKTRQAPPAAQQKTHNDKDNIPKS